MWKLNVEKAHEHEKCSHTAFIEQSFLVQFKGNIYIWGFSTKLVELEYVGDNLLKCHNVLLK